jgi:hypothetical protein
MTTTLRADGSPRISGIEVAFEDGELAFGSMLNARTGADWGVVAARWAAYAVPVACRACRQGNMHLYGGRRAAGPQGGG